jgi:uridylate kinase
MSHSLVTNAKRYLLKLSGEALQGKLEYGIDVEFLEFLAKKVVTLVTSGKEVVIVIG